LQPRKPLTRREINSRSKNRWTHAFKLLEVLRALMQRDPDWYRGEVTLLGDLDLKKQDG
jgi:hypothetical protein